MLKRAVRSTLAYAWALPRTVARPDCHYQHVLADAHCPSADVASRMDPASSDLVRYWHKDYLLEAATALPWAWVPLGAAEE